MRKNEVRTVSRVMYMYSLGTVLPIFTIVTTLFIDVAKNDLLAFKFGTNVVVVMIYLSSPRTKQTTKN